MNKKDFWKNVKEIYKTLRVIFIIIITAILYLSFVYMEKQAYYLSTIILIHCFIFALSYFIKFKVLKNKKKKKSKIKLINKLRKLNRTVVQQYFIDLMNFSFIGVFFHLVNLIGILIGFEFLGILTPIFAICGFFCTAKLIQNIGLSKLIGL